jgi:molecular chaperone DnaK (HSP70)
LKETLSANKEASIFIEGFINGLDLSMNIKREVIERSSLFSQITANLQLAVEKAGLTKKDIQSVEIIGGASRIPLVTKLVKDFFDPVEVGSHINGDESMAFGAALRAANLSIAFRVKQLHFYDGHP